MGLAIDTLVDLLGRAKGDYVIVGFPVRLKEVPKVNNFILAGLNIACDVNKMALMAELPTAETDSIRVAEAQRLLDLADALCLGETLENWLGGTQMFWMTRLI